MHTDQSWLKAKETQLVIGLSTVCDSFVIRGTSLPGKFGVFFAGWWVVFCTAAQNNACSF